MSEMLKDKKIWVIIGSVVALLFVIMGEVIINLLLNPMIMDNFIKTMLHGLLLPTSFVICIATTNLGNYYIEKVYEKEIIALLMD